MLQVVGQSDGSCYLEMVQVLYLNNILVYRLIFYKIKLKMYKQSFNFIKSSQNISRPSPTYKINSFLPANVHHNIGKVDLKKFNEYLEEKISNKMNKNRLKESRKKQATVHYHTQNNVQLAQDKYIRPPSAPKLKMSTVKSEAVLFNGKVNWKRHQSIEKLLEKQNKSYQVSSPKHQTKLQYQVENPLEGLQKKYLDLQQKYKILMQQTLQSSEQFEADQKRLSKLKQQHYEDQKILFELKYELTNIQKSQTSIVLPKSQMELKRNDKTNIQLTTQSDISISASELNKKSWKSRQFDDNIHKNEGLRQSKCIKTGQSWLNKSRASNINRQENELKRENYRYYSADKPSPSKRNSSNKKNNDHLQYEPESSTSIKVGDSLASSKVKLPRKLDFKIQAEKATPTTLHKKVLNNNYYSKYRFQPTVRLS